MIVRQIVGAKVVIFVFNRMENEWFKVIIQYWKQSFYFYTYINWGGKCICRVKLLQSSNTFTTKS